MTSLRGRSSAVVLTSMGLVLSVAGSASAQTVSVTDGAGNASKAVFGDRSIQIEDAPQEKLTDIVEAKFSYRRDVLVVVATMAEVKKSSNRVNFTVRVKGGGRDSFFTSSGRSGLFRFSRTVEDKESTGADACRGGSYKRSVERSTLRVRIPATCIDSPDQVRTGLSQFRLAGKGEGGYLVDDLNSKRVSEKSFLETRLRKPIKRG